MHRFSVCMFKLSRLVNAVFCNQDQRQTVCICVRKTADFMYLNSLFRLFYLHVLSRLVNAVLCNLDQCRIVSAKLQTLCAGVLSAWVGSGHYREDGLQGRQLYKQQLNCNLHMFCWLLFKFFSYCIVLVWARKENSPALILQ